MSCIGATNYSQKTIYLSDASATLHEFGHFLDWRLGFPVAVSYTPLDVYKRQLFKCAVEQNMMSHTIAAHFRTDPIHTRELRAYAVDEVKRTNGQVSFENAVHQQRRIEPEEEWPGSY